MSEAAFPPPAACDCHVHVIGPKSQFPLTPQRAYTPPDAPLEALKTMLAHVGLERVVLVQPSIYGTDNRCMLAALERLDGRGRAIAVLPEATSAVAADRLEMAGVRGLRINVVSRGGRPVEAIKGEISAAAAIAARNGWHVQLFIAPAVISELEAFLAQLPVETVFDHFGLLSAEHAESGEEKALLRLLESGWNWVKLSAPYRIAADPNERWLGSLARRIIAANPERVVWGSDWPHTPPHKGGTVSDDEEAHYRDIDTAHLLAALGEWADEPHLRRQILVSNPARLYRFG